MKRLFIIISIIGANLCTNAQADERNIKLSSHLKPYITFNDDTRITIRNDNIVIRTANPADGKVVITDDLELIVNRDTLELDDEQQKMVFEYYQLTFESIETARKIGWEGAKVGISGAAVGVKAIAGVFRMILPNYGPDDLERDMDKETAKIEAKAEKLEEKANQIDAKLEQLESLHESLKEQIPELKQLDWF